MQRVFFSSKIYNFRNASYIFVCSLGFGDQYSAHTCTNAILQSTEPIYCVENQLYCQCQLLFLKSLQRLPFFMSLGLVGSIFKCEEFRIDRYQISVTDAVQYYVWSFEISNFVLIEWNECDFVPEMFTSRLSIQIVFFLFVFSQFYFLTSAYAVQSIDGYMLYTYIYGRLKL